jgi:hypothetical protein
MTIGLRFRFLLLLGASIAFSGVAQAQLVAHWDFEEGAGDTTKNLITGDVDPLTDTTWVTDLGSLAPVSGGTTAALSFNGSSSVIDTAFEGIGGSEPRTIAMWVQLSDVTDEAVSQSLVTYGGRAANGEKYHFRINDGGDPRVRGAVRTEAQGGNQTGTTNIADGEWHHVASVFGGTDNIDVIHYVDGLPEGETGTTDEPINTTIGGGLPLVSIGARRQGGDAMFDSELSSFLNGSVDDVRIYSHALTQAEVQSLVPEPSSGVIGTLGVVLVAFAYRRRRDR